MSNFARILLHTIGCEKRRNKLFGVLQHMASEDASFVTVIDENGLIIKEYNFSPSELVR